MSTNTTMTPRKAFPNIATSSRTERKYRSRHGRANARRDAIAVALDDMATDR